MPNIFSLRPSMPGHVDDDSDGSDGSDDNGRGNQSNESSSCDEDNSSIYGDLGGHSYRQGGSAISLDGSATVHSTAFSLPDGFTVEANATAAPRLVADGTMYHEETPGLANGLTIRMPQSKRGKGKGKSRRSKSRSTFCCYTLLIIFCGAVASSAFLILGITGADRDQFRRFEKQASELVVNIQGSYQEYETAALWIHETCHANIRNEELHGGVHICSREDFLELYQYLDSGGPQILAAQFIPRVKHSQRAGLEAEAHHFYADHFSTTVDYDGITSLVNHDDDLVLASSNPSHRDSESIYLTNPSEDREEYYPIHYVAPIAGNEEMIELDVLSSHIRTDALHLALGSRLPTLTSRLLCYDHGIEPDASPDSHDGSDHHDGTDTTEAHYKHEDHDDLTVISGHYTLMLMHPGIRLKDVYEYSGGDPADDETDDARDNVNGTVHTHSNRRSMSETHGQHDTPSDDAFYADPESVSSVQISVMELLRGATTEVTEHIKIFLYEQTGSTRHPSYVFLGSANVAGQDGDDEHEHEYEHEYDHEDGHDHDDSHDTRTSVDHNHNSACSPIYTGHERFHPVFKANIDIRSARKDNRRVHEETFLVGNRRWTVVVAAGEDSYSANFLFYILGASFIMLACLCVALWFFTSMKRARAVNQVKAHARAEKATMIIQNSKEAARAERELNDFLAHEVRNPLSAAITASSFVSAEVNELKPLVTEESRQSVREDMHVIHSSLQFINDLLRNILDMHRASSQQMTIELAPTDVRADVLDPVATMLYKRNGAYQVHLECPEHLIIMTDRLRLKQIVMNLAGNARKFIQKGFIRLRAEIDETNGVVISVEDSGSGIPEEKKKQLFCKFQESLDSLSQGTGIGLALCKHLSTLLGGELMLDDMYDSGIEGCPGAKFVIHMNTEPVTDMEMGLDDHMHDDHHTCAVKSGDGSGDARPRTRSQDDGTQPADSSDSSNPSVEEPQLPQHLKVLFVDDDFVLRKLFMRSVKRVAPEWDVSEAANGETALRMTEEKSYDLIFLDQYMASVEKQLLGTETARAMRSKGVRSKICGLSANDMGEAFLKSGATSFMMKPFPCQKEALTAELLRVIYRPDVNIDIALDGMNLVMEDMDDDDDHNDSGNDGGSMGDPVDNEDGVNQMVNGNSQSMEHPSQEGPTDLQEDVTESA